MKINLLLQLFIFFSVVPYFAQAQDPLYPRYSAYQVLASSADLDSANYLAFPSILRLNQDEILISFKRGFRHGADPEAGLAFMHFDTKNNVVLDQRPLAFDGGLIHQMGEWVRFADQSIRLYIDTQNIGHDKDNYRAGLREVRMDKRGGKYVPQPTVRTQRVGEREYGYAFDFINDGPTTYMLVMGFGYRPGGVWSVDVIQSTDNGKSWNLVRNLTEEFGGHKINESAFVPWEDGYIVTTREYGHNQRIYKTDSKFRMVKEVNLSENYDFMESHIGRPRLFVKDDHVYLLGRNWRTSEKSGRRMELALFRLNPETLLIDQWVILDNKERANVSDGYYAVPYFQDRDGTTYLNLINYKGINGDAPSILRHEFIWEEIK